jgi:hypothetical protein
MNYVETIARFNNEAVSLLMAGETQIAIEALMKSVALLKPVLSDMASFYQQQQVSSRKKFKFSPQEDNANCAGSSSSPPAGSSPPIALVENICIHKSSSPLSSLTGRQNYIYNRAFHFSMEDAVTYSTTRTSIARTAHIYCAIIIFNVALAYHMGYLNGNKACAKRAIMLYSKVLKLLLKNRRGVAGGSSTAGIMKVAAMNNISQLRFEEGDYHRAQEGLDQLYYELMAILKDVPQELQNEYREILMNVIFLKAPKVAAAA